ncbi:MAG: hypothetical protein RLZZ340_688, partial [Actinomycetota bacterium]
TLANVVPQLPAPMTAILLTLWPSS